LRVRNPHPIYPQSGKSFLALFRHSIGGGGLKRRFLERPENLPPGRKEKTWLKLGSALTLHGPIRASRSWRGGPQSHRERGGARTTPSIVALRHRRRAVDRPAGQRQSGHQPEYTFFAIKRLIGRRFEDPMTQKAHGHGPFTRSSGRQMATPWVGGRDGKRYAPSEISAFILQKMKERPRPISAKRVTQPLITVPAYFNDAQRQATRTPARSRVSEVLRIINRADGGGAGYGPTRRTPAPSRSTTSAAAPSTSPCWKSATCVRGEIHQRRHLLGRRGFRPARGPITWPTNQERETASTCAPTARLAAPKGRR